MHTILLVGRATKDPEKISTKNKKSFVKFGMAINKYKGSGDSKEEKTFFYDILVFGKQSEIIADKLKKGDKVFVQGQPEFEAYISKKDNEAKPSVTILAETCDVMK